MRLLEVPLTIMAMITNRLPIPIAKRMPRPILRRAYEILYYEYADRSVHPHPNDVR